MKERPILLSAPMVRAILNGTKTQTRRAVKDRHIDAAPPACFFQWLRERCTYGQPGDILAAIQTMLRDRLEATRAQSADLVSAHAAELADIEQQLAHLADAVSKVGPIPALSDRLAATERRRADLQADIARIEAAANVNLSRIPALYRQMAFQLERALKTDVATAREVLRPLIEGARVVEDGGQVWVESETGRAAIAVGLSLGMVAGAGFEPATFGL